MKNVEDILTEKDKIVCPFLLAASFNGIIQFVGSRLENGVLYWQFTPKDKAQELIEQLETKTEPRIAAKDLFEAIDTFWKQVSELRNGE